MCVCVCLCCMGSQRGAGGLTEPDRGHSRESSCSYQPPGYVWTVNILLTDWMNHSLATSALEMMQKVNHCDTPNKSSSKPFGSLKSCGLMLQRNQMKTVEKSRQENSFYATKLNPSSSNPNTSTLLPTNLQNRTGSPDDSWLLSKVPGSRTRGLQQPQLYKLWPAAGGYFSQLEGAMS